MLYVILSHIFHTKIVQIVLTKISHYVMTDKQSELFIKFGKINWLWFYNNVYAI